MDSLHQLEIVILLLAVVLALTTIAQRILVPYPILLVIGGLLLAVIPGVPTVALNPDLVFLVFLPPILWAAAYFTSLRDFRDNLRPISLLALKSIPMTDPKSNRLALSRAALGTITPSAASAPTPG